MCHSGLYIDRRHFFLSVFGLSKRIGLIQQIQTFFENRLKIQPFSCRQYLVRIQCERYRFACNLIRAALILPFHLRIGGILPVCRLIEIVEIEKAGCQRIMCQVVHEQFRIISVQIIVQHVKGLSVPFRKCIVAPEVAAAGHILAECKAVSPGSYLLRMPGCARVCQYNFHILVFFCIHPVIRRVYPVDRAGQQRNLLQILPADFKSIRSRTAFLV